MYLVNIEQNRGLSIAASDLITERLRQVEVEGWTAEHDDKHDRGEMVYASASYALACRLGFGAGWLRDLILDRLWPWDSRWWKPTDLRGNLVKAGALILAEIERLDRLSEKAGQ